MISPITPMSNVMMSWLILQAMVSEIVFSRLPSCIYKILPRYSPTLLGVLTEKDTPDKTALKALRKLTR